MMASAGDLSDLAIVIVLFHSEPGAAIDYATGRIGTAHLVLVDNTPGRSSSYCHCSAKTTYIALGENCGIAAALNRGVDSALEMGAKLIVSFDQDSKYELSMLVTLVRTYERIRLSFSRPLAVGPTPRNVETSTSYLRRRDRLRVLLHRRSGRPDDGLLRVNEVITSGLMADASTYRQVGTYREDLFIDFVDHEWCWRLRSLSGGCFVDLTVTLPHMVGSGDVPFTLGMKLGSPHRLYYLFRNGVHLALSGSMPLYDAVKFLALVPVKVLVFGIFFRDRTTRVRHALRGLAAGIRWTLKRRGA